MVVLSVQMVANIVPDFISVAATRLLLSLLPSHKNFQQTLGLLAANVLIALLMAFGALNIIAHVQHSPTYIAVYERLTFGNSWYESVKKKANADDIFWQVGELYAVVERRLVALPVVLASLFTSIWLWLYAGSGFLLKAARRFDLGFDRFNRKFDIEKKPLQSIGLVAGVLVAVVYWTAVIVSRMIG